MGQRILGTAVAAFLVAAAAVLVSPVVPSTAAPTAAAACSGATGVSAFVDFAELGGGVTGGCARGGGDRPASEVFRDAGYTLEYSQQPGMSGFVCKVQSKPTDGDCAANDSFWSLWWSDGRSGRWVFSNQGVGTLDVPDGGYLAFAWHEGGGNAQPPAVAPTPREDPEPSDEPSESDQGDDNNNDDGTGDNGGGNGGGDGGIRGDGETTPAPTSAPPTASTASQSPSGPVSPGRAKTRRASQDPSVNETSSDAVPAADEITAGPPPSDLATGTSEDDEGALPTWIGLGLAVLVLGAAGGVTAWRRRSG